MVVAIYMVLTMYSRALHCGVAAVQGHGHDN